MFIVIGGVEIPVYLKHKRHMKDAYGMFHRDDESISLEKDQPLRLRRKTLVHECIHAYLYISGYTELLESVDDNFEEGVCRGFEQAMAHFFKFPKEIEDWIRETK